MERSYKPVEVSKELLERYNIDPALATGPFITTVNDVLGLLIYFSIGKAIL